MRFRLCFFVWMIKEIGSKEIKKKGTEEKREWSILEIPKWRLNHTCIVACIELENKETLNFIIKS